MLETAFEPEQALLIQTIVRDVNRDKVLAEGAAEELEHLARGAGLLVAGLQIISIAKIHPGTFIGKGRVEMLQEEVKAKDVTVVVFNHPLTPIQQRNLENKLQAKVVDRTGLILEIFASRARTKEGTLQVELASLLYQQSRLVRSWTHLERQRGGVGLRGGPGETQIEVDRRLIREKISRLKKQLKQVERTRTLQRQSRKDVPFFTATFVGYTNAGKSTLFNRLTQAEVYVADQLFATLDPTMRGITLPGGERVILSDTVGFIRDLPHQLVAAFRATLEEVLTADLLLHVVDLSDPLWSTQDEAVREVLQELGAGEQPILTLFNKVDCLDSSQQGMVERLTKRNNTILLSAKTGDGVDTLLTTISNAVQQHFNTFNLDLPAAEGALLAQLCQTGHVLERQDVEDRILLKVSLSATASGRLRRELELYKVA
ncbi:MAG: GTPase HflX [Magnetococcales bacterium]|nr:GTPase HflX [Magnetococcales bacterium]